MTSALISWLMVSFVLAADPKSVQKVTLEIGEEKIQFIRNEAEGLLLSEGCVWAPASKCEAYLAVYPESKKAAFKARIRTAFGASPGGAVCRELSGLTVIARDADKNETALCRFSDGSLIGQDSLYFQMKKAKRIAP